MKTFRYLSAIHLTEGVATSDVEVLRVGKIFDRDLEITGAMLEDYVRNFKENVYGVPLQVNLGHQREGEAAGWIEDLFLSPTGESLMMRVNWTELGREKIMKKLYKFVSAELQLHFPRHTDGKLIDNVFIGAALTNTPAMKDQTPVGLTEELNSLFIKRNTNMFAKLLTEYSKRAFLSAEDKLLVRNLLSELSPEEQEKHKDEVSNIEAKPEEAVETEEETEEEAEDEEDEATTVEGDKTEEEKLAEKKAKKIKIKTKKMSDCGPMNKQKEMMSETITREELAEKLNEKDAKIKALQEKLETQELSEMVENDIMLDESGGVGFIEVDEANHTTRNKIVGFLRTLSEAQRSTFKELLNEVRSVETGARGFSGDHSNFRQQDNRNLEEKILSLAEKKFRDGSAKTMAEAQDAAYAELSEKK
jgi:hypothetical protein